MWTAFPRNAATFDKETLTMSDQDRDELPMIEDDDSDDVEAHVLGGRGQYSTRGADDDSSDDVEAHKLL
jgi:hypothetical protein